MSIEGDETCLSTKLSLAIHLASEGRGDGENWSVETDSNAAWAEEGLCRSHASQAATEKMAHSGQGFFVEHSRGAQRLHALLESRTE